MSDSAMHVHCRFDQKRRYPGRAEARRGADDIKTIVEHNGGVYAQLYPYLCPDANHWHLSHYPQGYKTCPDCDQRVPAWNGCEVWVIGYHERIDGEHEIPRPCTGEGKHYVARTDVSGVPAEGEAS